MAFSDPDRAVAAVQRAQELSLETRVVSVAPATGSAERLAAALRAAPLPVICRVRGGCVLLDVRTLLPGDDERVATALAGALAGSAFEGDGAIP